MRDAEVNFKHKKDNKECVFMQYFKQIDLLFNLIKFRFQYFSKHISQEKKCAITCGLQSVCSFDF